MTEDRRPREMIRFEQKERERKRDRETIRLANVPSGQASSCKQKKIKKMHEKLKDRKRERR